MSYRPYSYVVKQMAQREKEKVHTVKISMPKRKTPNNFNLEKPNQPIYYSQRDYYDREYYGNCPTMSDEKLDCDYDEIDYFYAPEKVDDDEFDYSKSIYEKGACDDDDDEDELERAENSNYYCNVVESEKEDKDDYNDDSEKNYKKKKHRRR